MFSRWAQRHCSPLHIPWNLILATKLIAQLSKIQLLTSDNEVSGFFDADSIAAHVGDGDPQQLLVSLCAPHSDVLFRTGEKQSTRLTETSLNTHRIGS